MVIASTSPDLGSTFSIDQWHQIGGLRRPIALVLFWAEDLGIRKLSFPRQPLAFLIILNLFQIPTLQGTE